MRTSLLIAIKLQQPPLLQHSANLEYYTSQYKNVDAVLAMADHALYVAKSEGRNCHRYAGNSADMDKTAPPVKQIV